ncbi:hypothetical protein PFLUV_G00271050 [Perca fluviatilis]|uniref:Uncharacterized protein n=1 Tax=Perca fluviatilis TaxID=8168 RepID=A0A6A5E0U6_PERFL|nr:hypothetical protein PFLUV_G00271050 [Perca fluviatilis]
MERKGGRWQTATTHQRATTIAGGDKVKEDELYEQNAVLDIRLSFVFLTCLRRSARVAVEGRRSLDHLMQPGKLQADG